MSSKKMGIAAVLVLLLGGVSLGMYYGFREDPKMTAVRNLGAQLRDDSIPREQKREMFGQFREAMDQLTPEQRDKLRAESGRDRGDFGPPQKEIDAFFALPRKEQIAQIDKQIDQMEKWRKDREKRDRERAASNNGSGSANGGGGQNGRSGGGGGNGGGGPPRGGGSASDRAQQRRLALDNSTPQQRAQRTEMFRMMSDRRNQRGLPPLSFGGPGGGRGR